MNIGEAAARSGVPAKTIRYYEEVGLLPPPARADNGYRSYDDQAIEVLRFVQRSRKLGFSVKAIAGLLALWSDRDRASAEVKALASTHIAEVEARIAELQSIRDTLSHLVHRCHGDDRPNCPILDNLAGTGSENP